MTSRSITEWQDFIKNCIDFRPHDGVYRIARDMFTETELFDLEMEQIFEKVWIYACHESEIPKNNDFVTVQIGRQPLIVSRDNNGELHAMVNACEHRGATLTRVSKGNQATFTCPFHAWTYKSDGRLIKVKAPGEYCEHFDKTTRGLKQGRIASYRGFVFVSLDSQATDSLEDFLGDAKVFLDLMVDQSPTGELEVLQGKSASTFAGNWKLQNENGLDGYHVSTVHYNYVSTVQHRQQVNIDKGADLDTLDYSKLTDIEVQHYTRQLHEIQNPALAKRLKVIKNAAALLGERGGLVFKEVEKAVGKPSHVIKKLRQARNEAE